ncbi:acyltransferase family protein [Achromobacter aegrifaciens]
MLNNIQALRAIAALLVVLHHAGAHYAAMGGDNSLILALAQWGYVGVDLFFVISGFIITHTTMPKPRGLQGAATFAWHRLARIFLGYWPFFALTLWMAYQFPPHSVGDVDLLGSLFLTNPTRDELLVSISWSLTFELYFYALFVGTFWLRRELVAKLIPTAFVTFAIASVLIDIDYDSTVGFFASGFLLEFLAGATIGVLARPLSGRSIQALSLVIAVAAFIAGIYVEKSYELPGRAFTFGVSAAALLVFAMSLPNMPRTAIGRLVSAIGDSSYTIYLSHLAIISFFYYLGLRDWFTRPGQIYPLAGLATLLAICLVFSHVFYRRVELPIYRRAVSFKKPRAQHSHAKADTQ